MATAHKPLTDFSVAKFKKTIVTPGTRKVSRLNGNEEIDPITPSRIKSWVENTKKLRDLGVLIPAPFSHQDKNKKFAFPVIMGKDGETMADAYSGANKEVPASWDLVNSNAGWWEDFSQADDGSLVGEVNVTKTGFSDDVGNTVKETSVLVMPSRRVVDRDGGEHEIGEHLAHVALCLHPQEPGQSNFEPLTDVPASLAMSFVMAMDQMTGETAGASGPGTGSGMGLPNPNAPKDPELYMVMSLLKSAKNLALPEDTTRENFLQVLKIVLTQSLADEQANQKEESVTQRPEDAQAKSPSIAMSQVTPPNTEKPNTVEALLMSSLVKNKRQELTERVNALIKSGRITKKYGEEKLLTRVTAFAMSAADILPSGDFPKSALEELLDGLEDATPVVGESLIDQGIGYADPPEGADRQEMPQDFITGSALSDLTTDQADSILNDMYL